LWVNDGVNECASTTLFDLPGWGHAHQENISLRCQYQDRGFGGCQNELSDDDMEEVRGYQYTLSDPVLQRMLSRFRDMDIVDIPINNYPGCKRGPYVRDGRGLTLNTEDEFGNAIIRDYRRDLMCQTEDDATINLDVQECYELVNDRADFIQGYIHVGPVTEHTKHCGFEICRSQRCINLHEVKSSLNGNNGEWTNTDDIKSNKKAARQQLQKKQLRRAVKKQAKKAVRDSAIGFASNIVGQEAAKGLYGAGAKAIKLAKAYTPTKQKSLVLSDVSSRYLLSYVKPFDENARNAHVPTMPSYPSHKAMGFIRGTGYIGQKGVGWVALIPTVAKNNPGVYYTAADYNYEQTSQPANDGVGGTDINPVLATFSNLPYDATQVVNSSGPPQADISGRIVSAALRMRYTGTELNRSGNIYAYADPDNNNTLGGQRSGTVPGSGYTVSDLSTKEATEICSVSKRYTQVVILPGNSINLDYNIPQAQDVKKLFPYYNGENVIDNGTKVGQAPAVIMITGIPGQSFYFEAIVHVEYQGPGVAQSLMTESRADIVGLDGVQTLLAKAQRLNARDAQLSFDACVKKMMREEKIVMGSGRRSVDY